MYFIIRSFSTLSRRRMFAIMSVAVYRQAFVKRLLGLDLSIQVKIHFKGSFDYGT